MVVRVVRPLAGIVDGVPLRFLVPGATYDLPEQLARYLLEIGDVVEGNRSEVTRTPKSDSEPNIDRLSDSAILTGGVIVDVADE